MRTRDGGAVGRPPCGPRRGRRGGLARGWWGWSGPVTGPMPPSSAPAASGVCFTAQRTSSSSAMIGIFKNNISQMKVHVFTLSDRIPG